LRPVTTLKELERTIDSRLRWILDFEECELRMMRGSDASDDSDVESALPGPLPGSVAISKEALVRQALATGVPASVGMPITAIVYPLGLSDKPLGVLYLATETAGFSYRDLRLLHHVCSSLGAVLARIHQASIESELRANETRLQSMNMRLEQRVMERTSERDVLIAMFQATDMSIQVLDMDCRLLAINDAGIAQYKRMYGANAMIGDSLPEVLKGAPAQMAAIVGLWRRQLGGEAFTVQQEFDASASQPCSYEMRFEVLRGSDDMQIGAFMTAVDTTDSVRQQRALADTQEALRQSQKLEAIGQLTGGVAHDFNNVLAVIKAGTELLRKTSLNDERRQRFIESIGNAVTRGARLTGQLLAFARRQALQPEVFDAGENARAVAEMIGSLTGAGVEVNIHVSDQECLIDADPSQFDTALVNLAVNARDAMRARGTLTVRVEVVEAIPATKTRGAVEGEFVAVSLADTGTGIAPEHLEKIFEPFFTTKGVGHGTGSGLSQVFGFAHQSGGDVRVQSAPGAGSTFTLYLPRARAARVAPAATRKAADLPSGDGVSVLAVEDNPELAAVVDTMLQELGYASVVVPSAERALELLREEPDRFAAVLSDVMLPGMNGIDLANAIAESGIGAAVVLSSGYSQALVENPDHGFVLLAKPYALADLARALHAAVHRLDPPAGQEQPDMATVYDGRRLDAEARAEQARLAELAALHIMDSEEDEAYDELTRMAASFCEAPIALISLVDEQRQWFKGRVGLQARETPREHAFCAHAIKQPEQIMQVPDATLDARFAVNPLVTGEPGIRFYAGAPLRSASGHALGTLCVIDRKPRHLTQDQLDALRTLAASVVERLEARRLELGLAVDPSENPAR